MKATDLIHNGIYLVDGKLARFWALNGHFYTLGDNHCLCGVLADQNTGEIEGYIAQEGNRYGPLEIEPIPLTLETLESNEFTIRSHTGGGNKIYSCSLLKYKPNNYMKYVIEISWMHDEESIKHMRIETNFSHRCSLYRKFTYIHELQQALSVCGLSNIAENLKV